jgi:exonuclease I
MPVHFYDAITVGQSPSHGQVAQFHSVLLTKDQPAQLAVTTIRLRDDLWIDPETFEFDYLFDSPLDEGPDEYEWSREAARLFSMRGCLHIGFGSSTMYDSYIRNTLYRNLSEFPNTGHYHDSRNLDLATVIRAVHTLRPETLPWDLGPRIETDFDIRHRLMWDSGMAPSNRALSIINLLSDLHKASPSLVGFALSRTSVQQLKDAFGFEDGGISSLSSIKPCFLCHETIMTERRAGMFMPVAVDINNPDIVYLADLESDLSELCDPDYPSLSTLERTTEAETNLPLVRVDLSHIPFMAPLSAVRREDAARLGISVAVVKANVERLRQSTVVVRRLLDEPIMSEISLSSDADHRRLAGDYSEADRRLLTKLHETQLFDWPGILAGASDFRLRELGKRMLLRYAPGVMSEQEQTNWKQRVQARVAGSVFTPDQVEMILMQAENNATAMPTARGICDLSTRIQRLLGREDVASN